jgi:hypothetical protein
MTITGTDPALVLTDNGSNPDYELRNQNSVFRIYDATNDTSRLVVNTDGHIDIPGRIDATGGVAVTGNITVSGTVDGVDIAALNTTVGNITTDVVSDTSPQLGGDLDTNSFEISLDDDHAIKFGNDNDLSIKYDLNSNQNRLTTSGGAGIELGAPVLGFRNQAHDEWIVKGTQNGAVELYHDNTKMLSTESRGAILQKADACTFIIGSTNAGSAQLFLDGDSNGDGNGGDYSGIRHNSAGHLEVFADNPSTNASIYFKTGNSTNRALIDGDGHFYPYDNNTYDLGTSSYRWRNIYTADLQLSNKGSSNDIDGSWGDWTIQEGESDLFLKNNRSGKKYKFNLTEVS